MNSEDRYHTSSWDARQMPNRPDQAQRPPTGPVKPRKKKKKRINPLLGFVLWVAIVGASSAIFASVGWLLANDFAALNKTPRKEVSFEVPEDWVSETLYIPLIGGTGGNVGTQSSALVVQGLANSSLDAHNTWKQIVKESVVAVINATIISMLVYIYNFIRFGATATVSYSVSVSLFAVVMFASIFGTLVPMTLEKLKIDPAIATGPFISITNDIIGMMLYMGITVLLS